MPSAEIFGKISSAARRVLRRSGLALVLVLGLGTTPAAAAQAVALELVLAVDVSTSIDRREYGLQMQGLAQAFRSPALIDAIAGAAPDGIAVCLLQWAGRGEQRLAVDWQLVRDTAQGEAMAARIDAALRLRARGGTAIGDAIVAAGRLFDANGYDGAGRVIDVSGDGRANQGLDAVAARDASLASGITINALAILNEQPTLDAYYQSNVIGGDLAFVQTADDFSDFAQAILRKLVREIGGAQMVGPGALEPTPSTAAIALRIARKGAFLPN
ncbi:MAG: DUF1194 domain-containing protein [Alphaproteobacteria bacterium]|jgi:hypothetical protein|nr:DUF1194 domain-containing protein [Alphaproteobacteria bacterium]